MQIKIYSLKHLLGSIKKRRLFGALSQTEHTEDGGTLPFHIACFPIVHQFFIFSGYPTFLLVSFVLNLFYDNNCVPARIMPAFFAAVGSSHAGLDIPL